MKKILSSSIILIVCTLLVLQVQAQVYDTIVDSLENELKKVESDTQKVNILNEIAYTYFTTDPQKTIDYGLKAKKLADNINYTKGLAYASKNIGLGYFIQGDYAQTLPLWEFSLEQFEEINDKPGIANLLYIIGAVYYYAGDNVLALDYYLKSLRISEELKDIKAVYTALTNIGGLYSNKKETYDKALEYYKKALSYISEIKNDSDKGALFSNIGELYLKKKEYDSANVYLDKALIALEGISSYPTTLNLKGRLFRQQGEVNKAVDFQKKAIDIAGEMGWDQELTLSLIGLGKTYLELEEYDSALQIYNEAKVVAEEIGTPDYKKDVYGGLAIANAALNNYQQAYQYKDLYALWKDTIYNIKANEELAGLQLTYEIEKKQDEINLLAAANEIQQLETNRQRAISWGAGIIGFLLLILAIGIFRRYKFIRKIKGVLEKEKGRSDDLLLNILPAETAEELKEKGEAEAKYYESATILFTDFKGFTTISATMTPGELVKNLHECFKMFDIIITRHGLEKIKTIGDAYMAAGGIPKANTTHPVDVAKAAVEIRNYMNKFKETRMQQGRPYFEVRIGIHTGPIVSGIVGIKKFAYDIWGDTVNIAARMESTSEPGKINISENTFELIKDQFKCSYRGEIEAKNRGKLKMYFLNNAYDEELVSKEKDKKVFSDIKFVH